MTAPRVVLASASPRRRDLLTLIGIPHEVVPSYVDESVRPGELAGEHAERLARAKAAAVASDGSVTIGSDTIVVVDGDILGKPVDRDDAARMLRRLSGRTHVVVTAVAVRWHDKTVSAVERVNVTVRELDPSDIARYVETGEPMDKAGAYGIQGYGATLIARVEGDYFAVMGLPLHRLITLLASLGLRYEFGPITADA